jgi:RHS repeat-associated protein
LGNVLVTITDRRIQGSINNDTVNYYKADIASANDYYPFGMVMPGRNYTAPGDSSYRYGFNGKEKDKNISSLTAYDYGFRIYNPAIGKFLSVDPLTKKYPWYTPYQFASNKPVWAVDVDGLEGLVATGMPAPFMDNQRPTGMIITVEDARKIAPKVAEFSKSAAHSFVKDVKSLGKLKTYTDALDFFSLMFTPDVSSHMEENDQQRYAIIQGGINTFKSIPNWGPKEWGSATGHLAFQILIGKAIEVAGGVETPVTLRARLNSSDAVNAKFVDQGWEAPYVPGVTVAEFKTIAKTEGLVRLSGPDNVPGSWFTTEKEIKGLTPAQLKDKFSLPFEPTAITPVSFESGVTVRVGEAGAVKKFGTNGGGFQIEVLEGQNKIHYGTTTPLKH